MLIPLYKTFCPKDEGLFPMAYIIIFHWCPLNKHQRRDRTQTGCMKINNHVVKINYHAVKINNHDMKIVSSPYYMTLYRV